MPPRQRKKRNRLFRIYSPLVVLIIVIVWGIATKLDLKNPGAVPGQIETAIKVGSEKAVTTAKTIAEKTTIAVSPTDDSHVTPHIALYFAPTIKGSANSIDDAFLAFLRSANNTLDCAFYQLGLDDAADALIDQKQRGVRVRIVTDSDNKGEKALARCMAAGIPTIFDNRVPYMHDKFCVADGAAVWTGSTNITDNCMYRNDNNSLEIESRDLAADYTAEFEKMFVDKEFGKRSTRNTPHPNVEVDGVPITVAFSPKDGVLSKFLPEVKAAHASIDILAFSFTLNELSRAMAERVKNGVQVRAVFEIKEADNGASQDKFLAHHGATVHMDKNPALMHDKVIIVDNQTVITGSYNFSKNAQIDNDENLLILHSQALAERYTHRFETLFN